MITGSAYLLIRECTIDLHPGAMAILESQFMSLPNMHIYATNLTACFLV